MTITAKIIAHSIAPNGQQIVTFELEYQRFIHAEFLTHRLFSRNAASSRAIPVKTIIDQVKNNPAMPIHWGLNQSGMQAKEALSRPLEISARWLWRQAAEVAARIAGSMEKLGLHKQATNRILEPFQTMKTVMTATCMDNFFWLRNHEDAQPEIKELARIMWEALQDSTPFELKPGEWHTPYVWVGRNAKGEIAYGLETGEFTEDGLRVYEELSLENALKVSSSCCAQVSYRKLDDTLEKAQMVYKRLVESEPVHASPFEHQATPIAEAYTKFAGRQWEKGPIFSPAAYWMWPEGVTHIDKHGQYWSGNFVGWVQHRQLIPNNVCMKYEVSNDSK
ncbi:putative FAD-dependent thymidylate synthase [Pseudomonas phage 16Q]|nr:putative FAD-dependent thymidylate synthase [Pseudomonas phage 16Q]